jgi:hypothetical protein
MVEWPNGRMAEWSNGCVLKNCNVPGFWGSSKLSTAYVFVFVFVRHAPVSCALCPMLLCPSQSLPLLLPLRLAKITHRRSLIDISTRISIHIHHRFIHQIAVPRCPSPFRLHLRGQSISLLATSTATKGLFLHTMEATGGLRGRRTVPAAPTYRTPASHTPTPPANSTHHLASKHQSRPARLALASEVIHEDGRRKTSPLLSSPLLSMQSMVHSSLHSGPAHAGSGSDSGSHRRSRKSRPPAGP